MVPRDARSACTLNEGRAFGRPSPSPLSLPSLSTSPARRWHRSAATAFVRRGALSIKHEPRAISRRACMPRASRIRSGIGQRVRQRALEFEWRGAPGVPSVSDTAVRTRQRAEKIGARRGAIQKRECGVKEWRKRFDERPRRPRWVRRNSSAARQPAHNNRSQTTRALRSDTMGLARKRRRIIKAGIRFKGA